MKRIQVRLLGVNSQRFIFFVTYKRAQCTKVFVRGIPFQLSVMLTSRLETTLVKHLSCASLKGRLVKLI